MTLEPSEQILWTGAPQRIPMFEPLDRMALPFQALVIAAAVVFAVLNAEHPATAIVAWVFAAVGLLVVPARMIARRLSARDSRYTVTDLRLIVHTRKGEFSRYLRDLKPPVVYPHRNGTGTIEFGSVWTAWGPAEKQSPTANRSTLWGILDAQRVRDLVATAQETAPRE